MERQEFLQLILNFIYKSTTPSILKLSSKNAESTQTCYEDNAKTSPNDVIILFGDFGTS